MLGVSTTKNRSPIFLPYAILVPTSISLKPPMANRMQMYLPVESSSMKWSGNYQGKKILRLFPMALLSARSKLMRLVQHLPQCITNKKLPKLQQCRSTNNREIPLPHNERFELDFHKPYLTIFHLLQTVRCCFEHLKLWEYWSDSGEQCRTRKSIYLSSRLILRLCLLILFQKQSTKLGG